LCFFTDLRQGDRYPERIPITVYSAFNFPVGTGTLGNLIIKFLIFMLKINQTRGVFVCVFLPTYGKEIGIRSAFTFPVGTGTVGIHTDSSVQPFHFPRRYLYPRY